MRGDVIGLGLELRQKLNRISTFLSINIHAYLKEINVKDYTSFKLIDAPQKHRYIKFEVDGKVHRYNYKTKKEFLDSNSFWMMYQDYPYTYKNCVKNVY